MFSKYADLEVLGFTVPLRWFQEYRDLGPVENLREHVEQRWRSLGRRLTTDELYQRHTERETVKCGSGLTMSDRSSSFLGIKIDVITIAYQNSGNEIIDLYTRGQQETVALQKLKLLKALEDRVEAAYGISFNDLEDRELTAADIGGIYGLLENGFRDQDIKRQEISRMKRALAYFLYNTNRPHLSTPETTLESKSYVPRK